MTEKTKAQAEELRKVRQRNTITDHNAARQQLKTHSRGPKITPRGSPHWSITMAECS